MTDPKPPVANSGASRGFKILLAVSLALNLAVAGLVIGTALKFQRDGGRPMSVRDTAFGPFTEALSRDQRRALLKGMSERGGGVRQAREEFRADLAALAASLRQTPFDSGKFRDLLDQQGGRVEARANAGRQSLADLVATMPDAERLAFADRLERAMSDRHRARD